MNIHESCGSETFSPSFPCRRDIVTALFQLRLVQGAAFERNKASRFKYFTSLSRVSILD